MILNLYLRYKKYLASLSMLRHAVRNPLHIKTVKAKVFAFQCTFIVLAHIGDKFCHLFRSINGKSNRCGCFLCCPLTAVSACSRHSFVEGIRDGRLDVTQNRRSTRKIHFGRTKLPALQRFFSFPVLRGRIAWLIRF